MKILLLTPDMPYPSESGAAIRNFGIIRGLKAAGHQLTLLSFSDRAAKENSNPLFDLCESIHAVDLPEHGKLKRIVKLVSSQAADMEIRLASPAYTGELREILRAKAFDIIQFSGLELGCYLPLIQEAKRDAKVVYDALNAEAELQHVISQVDRRHVRRLPAALYSALQARRLRHFEAVVCRGADAVVAVSAEDRDYLRGYRGAPITVVPNGIATEDYAAPPDVARGARQLVFSGKMDYRPNVDAVEWFAEAVLPRIRPHCPDAEFVIVGRNPQARLRGLAADGGIQVTGRVESVQPYLHAATLYVAPLRMGSGTRLKVLQAMAAGCAVVSTSIGAAGLNPAVRGALEIADDADQFAQAVLALLNDEARRRDLGQSAQSLVRAHYDWAALIPRLLAAYQGIGFG